jgi:hypothetical protein
MEVVACASDGRSAGREAHGAIRMSRLALLMVTLASWVASESRYALRSSGRSSRRGGCDGCDGRHRPSVSEIMRSTARPRGQSGAQCRSPGRRDLLRNRADRRAEVRALHLWSFRNLPGSRVLLAVHLHPAGWRVPAAVQLRSSAHADSLAGLMRRPSPRPQSLWPRSRCSHLPPRPRLSVGAGSRSSRTCQDHGR